MQDNGPIHTSKAAQAQWKDWQQQGLFLFMLPKYCSEMNDIETEWHQLKTHEIAGQLFDNEYDLAIAVIDGITPFRNHLTGSSRPILPNPRPHV